MRYRSWERMEGAACDVRFRRVRLVVFPAERLSL